MGLSEQFVAVRSAGSARAVQVLEDAGLEVLELRPVIDGFTLVVWQAVGLPRFFERWWARESPPYRAMELVARARRLDVRTRNQIKLVLAGQFAFLARRP